MRKQLTKNINSFILEHRTGRKGDGFGVSAAVVTGSKNTTYLIKAVVSLLSQ